MIITVYDYGNDTKEITLPNKEIAEIFVSILSGDETGFVKFVDGTKIKFDASDCRCTSYYDGDYTLEGENIKKWIDFKPSGNRTVSYERLGIFDTEDEDEDMVFEDIKTGLEQAIAYEKNAWVVTENGCVITCPKCGERLELCYPDGTEVRYLPHCPWCGKKLDK